MIIVLQQTMHLKTIVSKFFFSWREIIATTTTTTTTTSKDTISILCKRDNFI